MARQLPTPTYRVALEWLPPNRAARDILAAVEEGRRRSPSLALIGAGSLALTTAVGVVAESQGGDGARAAVVVADEEARAQMERMGWKRPRGAALSALATELHAHTGVELLEPHGVFRIELPNGVVTGDPPRDAVALAAAAVVAEELRLLPPDFLEAAGLRRILLCEGLHEAGQPIPSLPNHHSTLLLDVDAPPAFLRRLLHHEIFHFADLADDGTVKRDIDWEALNPTGFAYGHGGRSMRLPAASEPDPRLVGFVTPYAQAAVEEDKAEIFAFMMTAPAELSRRAAQDGVLAAKIARMRSLTAALSDAVDDAFWRDVARARAR